MSVNHPTFGITNYQADVTALVVFNVNAGDTGRYQWPCYAISRCPLRQTRKRLLK
ncbi:hypothetical protein EC80566_2823 [Escherichia coli 8.0566]|nr:hypothetical protein EC80566_2823 [Escherichia coli 8.0566]